MCNEGQVCREDTTLRMDRRHYRKEYVIVAAVLSFILLAALRLVSQVSSAGFTRLEIRDGETGRLICSAVMRDGDQAVLFWKNSLFGLDVTEVFKARKGAFVLDSVMFADPRGLPPPEVAPADVDDLYHTGGPFIATGIEKSYTHVSYRVAEIGNPTMKLPDRIVNFKAEVGFGGGVVLSAAPLSWIEYLRAYI